jgi:NAD(P)-dependent dehydrogenase (short-subunit alcohol dehydrogenase family)
MSNPRQTAIVTGASQGIGAGLVKAFVERGFNVVANSRNVSQSKEVAASDYAALVDGDTGDPTTAAHIVEKALSRFKSIDVLVNNAGIFFTKPFTDYTGDDFKHLVSTNLEGATTAPDGRRMSINVEILGGRLMMQHYIEEIG